MEFNLPVSFEITHKGDDMQVQITSYANGSPKITVMSYTDGPYASLGKPSFPVLSGNLLVLDDVLPDYKSIIKTLISDGVLSATNNTHPSGYNNYGVYEFIGAN